MLFRSVDREVVLKGNTTIDAPLSADLKQLAVKARPGSLVKLVGSENRERIMTVPATGCAVFSGLRGESLTLRIELPGWEPYEQTLLLDQDRELQTVQKRVLTSLTVRTAPFADIALTRNGETVRAAKANSLGVAVIDEIPADNYRLAISCAGYHARETDCDLTQNRNLDMELGKITYDLDITAAANTHVAVFLDNRRLGTYLVPDSGRLHLPALHPGNYSISAEKTGMVGQRFSVRLDRNKSLDCRLTAAAPPSPAESAGPVGTIKVYLLASTELMQYIQDCGLEISIDGKKWTEVRKFPWS